MQTLDQIVQRRVSELCAYFRGRFGRSWRIVLARRLGVHWRSTLVLTPKRRCISRLHSRAEALAFSLGFVPSELSVHMPYRRNGWARFEAVCRSLEQVAFAPGVRESITFRKIFTEWRRRNRKCRTWHSDVIDDCFLDINPPREGVPNPAPPSKPPGWLAEELLDSPALPPTCPCEDTAKRAADAGAPSPPPTAGNSAPADSWEI